jgi:hypothetical protein
VVGARPVHIFAASPAPKVAAADNYCHLNAHARANFHLTAYGRDDVEIKAEAVGSGKRLSAYFK